MGKRLIIHGAHPLYGDVRISGFKNAAASILPGTLLVDGICIVENVPDIGDVRLTIEILQSLGARVRSLADSTLEIDSRFVSGRTVSTDLAGQMRASHFFLGALLGRFGEGRVSLPGGCDLGKRPIDQHLKGFEAMGASVRVENGAVHVSVQDGGRLKGTTVRFDMVTVGATMNLMLASALADGETVLENAAKEPHIVDLAGFLNAMGAEVRGAGSETIRIRGVRSLPGGLYSIIPDQIEAGTYMAATAAAGGEITVRNVIPGHLACISSTLREMGAEIEEDRDYVVVRRTGPLHATDIKTMPYPGFPTDMQPQFGALMSVAQNIGHISETIWPDRFRYVDGLRRMGAQVVVRDQTAVFKGCGKLRGADVSACDLRAGAALIIAGLAAEGTTRIDHVEYIERGYENIAGKLRTLGADIWETEEA